MAFTFEKVCRACMESISVGPLVSKKKVKTKISEMFEAISNIRVSVNTVYNATKDKKLINSITF